MFVITAPALLFVMDHTYRLFVIGGNPAREIFTTGGIKQMTEKTQAADELCDASDNRADEEKDDRFEREQQRAMIEDAMGIKRLHTITSDVLFEKQLEKRKFIVEGLLPEGLTVLSGDPKAGKSFFALNLAVSVAKGVPFLCFPTAKSEVLYFSFKKKKKRLQQRLFEMSDDTFSGLTFSNDVLRLGDGFIETIEDYLQKNPGTKLVVVDTLNYIRPEKQGTNMYKNDYDDMIKLHRLTMQYGIAMLILHHNKKGDEEDPLRSISGSMGISGGVDNVIVINKPKKKESASTIQVVGRDMPPFEMKIVQSDNGVWTLAEEKTVEEKKISIEIQAAYIFYCLVNEYKEPMKISPTDLSNALHERLSVSVPPTMIKKKLTAEHEDLELLGLKFDYERTKQGRKLVFRRNKNFRNPKHVHLYEDGSFYVEVFSPEEFENKFGDRVTGETDSESISSSAVNSDDPNDAVTDESRCESNCQPVTACQSAAANISNIERRMTDI